MGADLLAVGGESVFLRVVEVVLQGDPWVALERRVRGGPDVEAVVLGSGLKEEALGFELGVLETLGEVDYEVGCSELADNLEGLQALETDC